MPTRNISLPKELDQFIEAKVASGEYAHYSEVVRDAVRDFMDAESQKLEWLREAIRVGVEEADRGELIPIEQIRVEDIAARGRAKLAQLRKDRRA